MQFLHGTPDGTVITVLAKMDVCFYIVKCAVLLLCEHTFFPSFILVPTKSTVVINEINKNTALWCHNTWHIHNSH